MYQIFQECSKHSIKCTKCTITFQTTFFLKQNYRLTIIHSQTYNFLVIHSNCHKNLVIYILSISYILYISYILSISYIDYRYFYNFPHTIQALISINAHNYFQTTSKTIHHCPIIRTQVSLLISTMFFSIYFLLKTKNDTLNFYVHSITFVY